MVEVLIDFAASALRGGAEWALFAMRMAELAEVKTHAMTEQIRHEAGTFGIFSEFGEWLDELFWAEWYMHESIAKGAPH
jgi:hypothetical protein